jgi:hypothetical protein
MAHWGLRCRPETESEAAVHIEFNAFAQVIAAGGGAIAAVLTALSKFLPVWRSKPRKGNK